MPLVNAQALMTWAISQESAVAAFNIDTLEVGVAIARAADACHLPVFLQVTTATLDIWGWELFFDQLAYLAQHSSSDICVQLDHAAEVSKAQRALGMGFPSVMYDGSHLPFDENVRNTLTILQTARQVHATVEAEIGHVYRAGEPPEWQALTRLEDAQRFMSVCPVDMLAVSVGTVHGQNRTPQDIDIERLKTFHQHLPDTPFVLHGGSGVPDEVLSRLVDAGIRKVNVGTELRRIWWNRIDSHHGQKPREVMKNIMADTQQFAEGLMRRLHRMSAAAGPV
ncbi:ketose-bisphosphate aldolase [Sulfobacillus acidophilus TPY]|uniref:Tagatose-bisphosphate aldolase n=1 Tax=Sulfobacillus acidophilus (strain ATCC 700253 / DSM 10332 / NAL) TaxID=679936 RepID=G8TTL8_SULAD|nr:ketose-bisphosphate aldolase [Sulfobacillus acidophilus TPY]AEW05684.1 Tagatose-bisphosphate aldolase [Sulfobacillus acidophilus DSM 10332]